MKHWTKERLNNLGIYEIRTIARDVGVKSPTVLKKEEAIAEILKIASGAAQPYQKPNNKGRPPREIGSVKNIIDVFMQTGRSSASGTNADVFSSQLFMASGNDFTNKDAETKKVCGILEVMAEGYGFLYANDFKDSNIFINESLIVKNCLQSGDKIAVQARKISADGKFAAVAVDEINNKTVNEYATLQNVVKNQTAEKPAGAVAGLAQIKKGFKVAVNGSGRTLQEKIIKMFNLCCETKILLNTNSHEEDYVSHSNCINVGMFEEKRIMLRKIELTVMNALNMAALGSNIVLFITDLTFFPKTASQNNTVSEAVDAKALGKARQLFAYGKKFSGGGSLTVVAGLNDAALNAKIINPELAEVANLII